MFPPLLPIQQVALAGMLAQRNELAIEQNKIALEQQETLKRIEQQNKETLERIEEQEIEKQYREERERDEPQVSQLTQEEFVESCIAFHKARLGRVDRL
jgi:hypothetical protein